MKTHSGKWRSNVSDCEQGKFATFGEKSKRKSQNNANTMRVVLTLHRVHIGYFRPILARISNKIHPLSLVKYRKMKIIENNAK
jgi:hypothetical protein